MFYGISTGHTYGLIKGFKDVSRLTDKKKQDNSPFQLKKKKNNHKSYSISPTQMNKLKTLDYNRYIIKQSVLSHTAQFMFFIGIYSITEQSIALYRNKYDWKNDGLAGLITGGLVGKLKRGNQHAIIFSILCSFMAAGYDNFSRTYTKYLQDKYAKP